MGLSLSEEIFSFYDSYFSEYCCSYGGSWLFPVCSGEEAEECDMEGDYSRFDSNFCPLSGSDFGISSVF